MRWNKLRESSRLGRSLTCMSSGLVPANRASTATVKWVRISPRSIREGIRESLESTIDLNVTKVSVS